ncbi:MAG: hypothetical protein WB706_03365 [Nitrososphaeraceae archaeon]
MSKGPSEQIMPILFTTIILNKNITELFDPMDLYVPLAKNYKFKVFITLVCSLNNAEYLYIMDSMYRSIRKSEMT